jgi:CRISPR-associated protein Cas1
LGFIHTGRQLSFVYDIADLYKVELTIPLAFRLVAESLINLEARVRHACRDVFREKRLLDRILPDIDHLLGLSAEELEVGSEADSDPALPEPLWSPPLGIGAGVVVRMVGNGYGGDRPGESAGVFKG